jgi:hypothetical protein
MNRDATINTPRLRNSWIKSLSSQGGLKKAKGGWRSFSGRAGVPINTQKYSRISLRHDNKWIRP